MVTNSSQTERSHLLSVGALARLEVPHAAGTLDIEGTISAVDDQRVTVRFRGLEQPLSALVGTDSPAVLKLWDRFGMHRAEAVVHAVIEEGRNAAVIIAAPTRFVGTQTRRFFRVSARLELALQRAGGQPATTVTERALSCDVSAGGLSFLSDSLFEIDDHVVISMMLPNEVASLGGDLARIDTRVVRSESVPDTDRRFFGVEFQSVTPRQRDRLIEVMLGLQRIVR
jgi:PilZ domain